MAEILVERISDVSVRFEKALIIGQQAGTISKGLTMPVVRCGLGGDLYDLVAEEDRLPIADQSFDLVIACGTLDTVDDLPGALILINRVLKPGGLFMGAMMGAGSLPTLRDCISQGDAHVDKAAARFHPQIDVRAAGDLLSRAGFVMQVADQDRCRLAIRFAGEDVALRRQFLPQIQPRHLHQSVKVVLEGSIVYQRNSAVEGHLV